ncbi:MAG: TetR/AcrR family transcriptional regulator C-terminal domain-containing protein [Eubacterium sp.]|nr:TetR/AcrR family transcriptional regulator C-terminal domain-containing protein [Eubacterium sp.]
MAESNITKNALADALKSLMREKSFEKISVLDICEKCNMNRKSFYYHFRDKYDLLNWIFYIGFLEHIKYDGMEELLNEKIKEGSYGIWELITSLAEYFYTEKEFYRKALMIEGQNSFKDYFHDGLYPIVRSYMDDVVDDDETGVFTILICDTCISALVRWLTSDSPDEPAVAVREMQLHLVKFSKRILQELGDMDQ